MNSSSLTKDHTYSGQYQVRGPNSPASVHHIAPEGQYSKLQNMCNTLQHIIMDIPIVRCFILP